MRRGLPASDQREWKMDEDGKYAAKTLRDVGEGRLREQGAGWHNRGHDPDPKQHRVSSSLSCYTAFPLFRFQRGDDLMSWFERRRSCRTLTGHVD